MKTFSPICLLFFQSVFGQTDCYWAALAYNASLPPVATALPTTTGACCTNNPPIACSGTGNANIVDINWSSLSLTGVVSPYLGNLSSMTHLYASFDILDHSQPTASLGLFQSPSIVY